MAFSGGWGWRLDPAAEPKMTSDEPSNGTKMTLSDVPITFGGNSPVSLLDSTVIPKVTALSSSASSSGGPSSSDDGWGEV
jgi:hypothetical protein